jgi:hypothetical protein
MICTASVHSSLDTIYTMNRSRTPDLEVKSPAINFRSHDNVKVQKNKTSTEDCIHHKNFLQ